MPKKDPEKEAKRQRHRELTEFLDSVLMADLKQVYAAVDEQTTLAVT